MYDRRQKIMEKIKTLPKGAVSPSGRYWCVTCKKLFRMDAPVCPYMTAMCVNAPISVESYPPESALWMEKMGLFYPKIPQRIMGALLKAHPAAIGRRLAAVYLDFLAEWRIACDGQPLQTMKSFVLFLSGCETAQRVAENEITLVVTDMQKIWDEAVLFPLLEEGLDELKGRLGVRQAIRLDRMEILGERDMGKYFCGMCRKFFEFGLEREKVTCPLMAQKCMFDPVNIKAIKSLVSDYAKVLRISPDLYARFLSLVPRREEGIGVLRELLTSDWKFAVTEAELAEIAALLGLSGDREKR